MFFTPAGFEGPLEINLRAKLNSGSEHLKIAFRSTFGLEDGNLIISWPTAAGHTYQVQRSTDLESWENIGVALTGNGTTMSYSQPSNADKVFLRVVIP